MTLASEVTQKQEETKRAKSADAKARGAKTLEDAAQRFRDTFEEEPARVEWHGREIENARARDWPDRVQVVIAHDGIRFAYMYGSAGRPELRVILECADCGRDYLGEAVYATYPRGDSRAPAGYSVRASAIEHLARALAPAEWRAHECEENVMRPVWYAIKSAADKLRVPAHEVAARALRVDNTQRMF